MLEKGESGGPVAKDWQRHGKNDACGRHSVFGGWWGPVLHTRGGCQGAMAQTSALAGGLELLGRENARAVETKRAGDTEGQCSTGSATGGAPPAAMDAGFRF